MRTINRLVVSVLVLSLVSTAALALIMTQMGGSFPPSWPAELAPYSAQSTKVEVAHGIQEDVYEIPFKDSEDFAKAWPYILKLKSKGAPLILERSPSTYSTSGSTMKTAGVRVIGPANVQFSSPGGTDLHMGPPWPESILSPTGELPEYVVIDNGRWVPFTGSDAGGFRYRARVDIVLVVDGKIVDLNKIALPEDTPIIDRRFLQEKAPEGGSKRSTKSDANCGVL